MTKKWTYEEYKFARNSAWSAFSNTLKAHGITDEEVFDLFILANASITELDHCIGQIITWEEE